MTTTEYIGRFAPTPSGPLHFGSLVAAVGSYLDARAHGGQWLLRIDDLDQPRVKQGAADHILHTLENFYLHWDGPVLYQSTRNDIYEQTIEQLTEDQLLYACSCSRRQLKKQHLAQGPLGFVYPGICRDRKLGFAGNSLRLRIEQPTWVSFEDRYFGKHQRELSRAAGDIVLKRRDGIHAYHLAVVLDDAAQGVTDIVRGADLHEASFVHLHLSALLHLTAPRYLHLPLARDPSGVKLSKQTGATPVDSAQPTPQLWRALQFLGQTPPGDLHHAHPQTLLEWGITHWQPQKLPATLSIRSFRA